MQIVVPAERPYVGRHRQVGEVTVEVRPRDLAELDGPTRLLNMPSGVVAAARAVWGLWR